jgi:sugar lactone lactonase YvrE
VEVVAGIPWSGEGVGTGDGGQGLFALIPYPTSIAFDGAGNLVVASDRIRQIDKNGVIRTVLGRRDGPLRDDEGDPLQARLGSPQALTFDSKGSLYVADTFRNRVLRFAEGRLTVIAGLTKLPEEREGGPAEFVRHSNPWAVAVSPSGDLFVADTGMNRICLITSDGKFYTVAGKGQPIIRIEGIGPGPQFSGDGGSATIADLDGPSGVAVDAHGNIYISDSNNNRVRKVTSDGIIHTIAGTGENGFGGDGGPATAAKLSYPMGLAVDILGNLYIADRQNNRVRQVTPDGNIRTVIGNGAQADSGDGPALSVKLDFPHGVAVDRAGALYVADTFNHRIRKLGKDGIVRTIAGTGKQEFKGDEEPAIKAGLATPDSLAIDQEGNIFIADRANWRVRKITTDGVIHTIAGNHETGFSGDGGPALKAPIFPTSIAVDARGLIYVTHRNTVRILTPQN